MLDVLPKDKGILQVGFGVFISPEKNVQFTYVPEVLVQFWCGYGLDNLKRMLLHAKLFFYRT